MKEPIPYYRSRRTNASLTLKCSKRYIYHGEHEVKKTNINDCK